MGMDIEDFDMETSYDERAKSRMIKLITNKDIKITFETDFLNTILKFDKGDKIITWRHIHNTMIDIMNLMNETGFKVKHVITSPDEAHALFICKRKL